MNSKTSARTSRSAFTLIELLVVIAIVSLLVSILLPALEQAKELTRVTVCQSNVRGISLAMIYYMEDNGGRGPQYYDQFSTPKWWSQALMKDGHLEGYGMLDCPTAADEGISHRSGDNLGLVYGVNVCLFGCRTDKGVTFTPKKIENSGKASEKLMIVEGFAPIHTSGATRDNAEEPWFVLYDWWGSTSSLTSRHDGDANLAFVDGHVEKGKEEYDSSVDRIFRYWRDDVHRND